MKKFLKTIIIIHSALIAGQVIFMALAYIKASSHNAISINANNIPFIYIAPIVAIAAVIASNVVFNKQLSNVWNIEAARDRLNAYQAALIRRYALLEGTSMFVIAIAMITANLIYFVIAGLLVIYQLSLRPTEQRVQNDLRLTYQDTLDIEEV